MSIKAILLILGILIASAGGVGVYYGTDLLRDEPPAQAEQPTDVEDTVAGAAVAPEDSDIADAADVSEDSDVAEAEEAATPEPLLVAPSLDILRVEPSGELIAAGRAAPRAEVEMRHGSETIVIDTANNDGEWTMVPDAPLPAGEYDLVIRATGEDGQGGPIEGDRVAVMIAGDDTTPLVAVTRPGEPSRIVQRPDEPEEDVAVAQAADAPPAPPAQEEEAATPEPAAPEPVEVGEVEETTETAEAESESEGEVAESEAVETVEAGETPEPVEIGEVEEVEETTETAEAESEGEVAESEAAEAVEGVEAVEASETPEPVEIAEALPTTPEAAEEPVAEVAEADDSPDERHAAEMLAALPDEATEPAPDVAEAPEAAAADTAAPADEAEPAEVAEEAPSDVASQPLPVPPMVAIDSVEVEGEERLYVSGRADPEASIRVYVNQDHLGDARSDGEGDWAQAGDRAMPPGRYTVRADIVDEEGAVRARAEVRFDRVRVAMAEEDAPPSDEPAATEPAEPAEPETVAEADPAPAEEPMRTGDVAAQEDVTPAEETGPAVAAVEPEAETAAPEPEVAAVPEPAAVTDPEPDTVYIERGDNLWRIARSIYGQGIRYTVIYEANRNQIRDPSLIYPGQVFTIPLDNGTEN
jgi:nucleoid-associated protein YgaU